MSNYDELSAATDEATAETASAMDNRAVPTLTNVLGPRGESKRGIFRPASQLEQLDADKEMTLHGFKDRTLQILLIPRSQFASVPYEWRGKSITQLAPVARQCLVSELVEDDPYFFSFVLISRQPPRTP